MFQILSCFSFRRIFSFFFVKNDVLNISKIKSDFNEKITLEIKENFKNQSIFKIDLVYSDFLFPSNADKIKLIFKTLNLDSEILTPNCGVSLFLVVTQTHQKYIFIRIINEEITQRITLLVEYNDLVSKYFNVSYPIYEYIYSTDL